MEHLTLKLKTRADFAKYGPPAARAGELFLPTPSEIDTGERVTVEILFDQGPRLLLHGTIQWRRAVDSERSRAGIGIVLLPEEQSKLAWLYDYVAGFPPGRRDKRRLPVRLRVVYAAASARRVNFTRDLNEDGAFVRAAELPAVGDSTSLRIHPPTPDYHPFQVDATVAWVNPTGDRGFGVSFDAHGDDRTRLEDFVRRLDEDYLSGTLPDEVLL